MSTTTVDNLCWAREQFFAAGMRGDDLEHAVAKTARHLARAAAARPGDDALQSAVACWHVELELGRYDAADAIKATITQMDPLAWRDMDQAGRAMFQAAAAARRTEIQHHA